ncbi:MAG: hypothetical protein F2689_00775 [Actinobacteria bacterium]|nr:hypothetical protein [Actinomycetota bacterium]MSY73915.1 hypothetical protein [Actinomycetota bacterium]
MGLKVSGGGWFVDVGACNPKYLSNTFLLETDFGWNGLLIEPSPESVQLLRKFRKCAVIPVAISSKSSVKLEIAIEPEFNTTNAADQKHHRLFKTSGRTIRVEGSTLSKVFVMNCVPDDFEYLSIDCEGDELEVLKTNDWLRFKPKLISVNHNFRSDRVSVRRLLEGEGYILDPINSQFSWDAWYLLPEVLEDRGTEYMASGRI